MPKIMSRAEVEELADTGDERIDELAATARALGEMLERVADNPDNCLCDICALLRQWKGEKG